MNARKLPSGSWRCQVYSHSEPVFDHDGNPVIDPKTNKQKQKRIYESFTNDDPSQRGKRQCEKEAAIWADGKERRKKRYTDRTLRMCILDYIDNRDAVLSPKTVSEYKKIVKNAFADIMDMKLKEFTPEIIQAAVNQEAKRPNKRATKARTPITPKTVRNEYGLVVSVLGIYFPELDLQGIRLPAKDVKIKELPLPELIFDAVKGTSIELPVLIAMWLSFSMSEIRGLKRSSITSDGYLVINQVVVDVDNKPVEKEQAKVFTRIRKHKIPAYIMTLIDAIPETQEYLVPLSGPALNRRFKRIIKKNSLPDITFHDLRHINASVMAMLHIPDRYAMERGGWKTDSTMKKVYTHTFSAERQEVDRIIDQFFESQMQHEMQHASPK